MLTVKDVPSPNFDARRSPLDMLVLHYTGMKSADEAVARLCDPEAKVSAHYVVDEDGAILRLVAEERRAWHAGKGGWQGETDCNAASIGIEIVNPGHEFGYRDFPEVQIDAVISLVSDIRTRWTIPDARIKGVGLARATALSPRNVRVLLPAATNTTEKPSTIRIGDDGDVERTTKPAWATSRPSLEPSAVNVTRWNPERHVALVGISRLTGHPHPRESASIGAGWNVPSIGPSLSQTRSRVAPHRSTRTRKLCARVDTCRGIASPARQLRRPQ